MCRTIKILISNLPRTRNFSQLLQAGKTVAFDFSHDGHALVTPYVQFLCSDWSKFDRSSCGKFMQHLETCLLWQLKLTEFCVNRCTRNEIQLLPRVFCYSWLACLLGFWLRNTSLVKVGNPISDGIVFVFHLAWCVRGLNSLKRFWPYLIASRSCILNGKPE